VEIAADVHPEVAEYDEPAGSFEAEEPVEDVHEDASLQEGASWLRLTLTSRYCGS
jgi:hypothetical protein